jgi:hypothetical protein
MSEAVTIRPVEPQDREGWGRLYAGYAAFYMVTQTDDMRDRVWSWLMSGENGMNCLVAEDGKGKLIGFRPPLAGFWMICLSIPMPVALVRPTFCWNASKSRVKSAVGQSSAGSRQRIITVPEICMTNWPTKPAG